MMHGMITPKQRMFLALTLLAGLTLHAQTKRHLLPEINGPVLKGEEAIAKMRIAEGYELTLVAEEPDVINPVVMRFDEWGRLWVVEMVGYMNDIEGTQDLDPVGRISILEDTNGDGKRDKATVFLDKLIEPRAMAFHKNGILWADTQKLYHTEIVDAYQPGKTVVVDENYGPGRSVEHKTNGLIRAIDNWYYNAKSKLRYKEVNGKWLIEETEFRGQFSLSADNHGRLYHGQQNTLMRADIFAPNFFMRNPKINIGVTRLATKNNEIQSDCFNIKAHEQPVFPVRNNKDMRDGYTPPRAGHVDQEGFAYRVTAACGHFFYRDNYFPDSFNGIIPDPAVHIVKVLTLTRTKGIPFGKDAFVNEEVIASPDTRFRPVDVRSGPDGTLYIADLYHGILQHKIFMNKHLTRLIGEQKLDGPDYLGRIYRLTIKRKQPNPWRPLVNPTTQELVDSLASSNPWRRDHAQRILVDKAGPETARLLETFLGSTRSVLGKMHALWTLEGIGAIQEAHVLKGLGDDHADVRIHATRISWQLKNTDAVMNALVEALPPEFHESAYYIVQRLANFDQREAQKAMSSAYLKWHKEPFLTEAIVSGSGAHLIQWVLSLPDGEAKAQMLSKALLAQTPAVKQKVHLKGKGLASYRRGETIYRANCFACHHVNGAGLSELGPPLVHSEWVRDNPERLAKILLKGMEGEISVNGKTYKPTAAMPGLEAIMNDTQIANVMTYIRHSWGHKQSVIDPKLVRDVRKQIAKWKGPYKESELR